MGAIEAAIQRLDDLLEEYRRSLTANGGGVWREPEAVLRDLEAMPAELEDAAFVDDVLGYGEDDTAAATP